MVRRLLVRWLVATVAATGAFAAIAAAAAFRFGGDLMFDGKTTRDHKRLPRIAIEQDGAAAIDLWCESAHAQAASAPAPF